MRGKGGQQWDEDDYYDEQDWEEEGGWEDEYDEVAGKPAAKVRRRSAARREPSIDTCSGGALQPHPNARPMSVA